MKSRTKLGTCEISDRLGETGTAGSHTVTHAAWCLKMMWLMAVFLSLSNCVSRRYVVNQPDRVIGNWEMVDMTPPGTGIDLLLAGGDTASGTYQGSTENEVTRRTPPLQPPS